MATKQRKRKWRAAWTTWRTEPGLLEALDVIAERREQSRSTVMRRALWAFVEREQAKQDPAPGN